VHAPSSAAAAAAGPGQARRSRQAGRVGEARAGQPGPPPYCGVQVVKRQARRQRPPAPSPSGVEACPAERHTAGSGWGEAGQGPGERAPARPEHRAAAPGRRHRHRPAPEPDGPGRAGGRGWGGATAAEVRAGLSGGCPERRQAGSGRRPGRGPREQVLCARGHEELPAGLLADGRAGADARRGQAARRGWGSPTQKAHLQLPERCTERALLLLQDPDGLVPDLAAALLLTLDRFRLSPDWIGYKFLFLIGCFRCDV
jgi:hypothetical protein